MADEATVENLPVNRFFCHKCSLEITGVLPDYTCPNCQSGFIEALEPEPADDSDTEMENIRPVELLNSMFMNLTEELRREEQREERRGGSRRSTRASRNRQMAPLENLIQDFIVNLTGVGGWGAGASSIGIEHRPGGQVRLFLGNPGDYAWGREGLDAIVTQLLNQMDTTGPPPLAKDKIQQIPSVVITEQQVEINLQCSVCWEDFKVAEQVRKLPCEHVYHDTCIVPWLELHGTCPICRKTLSEEASENSEIASNQVGGLAAFFRVANESSSSSSTDAASTSSSANSSSSSSRPDFQMDMDFD